MKKNITVELCTGFKLVAQNNCQSMGQYYFEDDWRETCVSETWNEVFEKYWKAYATNDICPSDIEFYEVEYIQYNDEQHIVSQTEISKYKGGKISPIYTSLHCDLQAHPEANIAAAERSRRYTEEKERKEKAAAEELKQKEIATLRRLAEKHKNIL